MKLPRCLLVSILLLSTAAAHLDYLDEITNCAPRRDRIPDGQICHNRCISDRDCRSQDDLVCVCDGNCGKSCVKRNLRCSPHPKHIPNGNVVVVPYNRFGAIVKYKCNYGYRLEGLPARVCRGDETWMGDEPVCLLTEIDDNVRCGPPPHAHNASHGGHRGRLSYELGTDLVYTCNKGFVLDKGSVDRAWCVPGGSWIGPNMTCIASGCRKPIPPKNGYLLDSQSQIAKGGGVTFRCNTGYFVVGNPRMVCQPDGTWMGEKPSCENVVCGPPPIISNAAHDGLQQQMYNVNSVLTYTCERGYHLNHGAVTMAKCTSFDGNWNGPSMTCQAKNCKPPDDIMNGRRDPGYRFTHRSRVTYSCNDGFELKGPHYRQCLPNGKWSEHAPQCDRIHCDGLQPPVSGTMIGSDTHYGAIIRFKCNNGFHVVGSRERVCQADRHWSGQDTECKVIDCGQPGILENGYVDGHRTTVNAVLHYRCNIRTTFHGASFTTTCLPSGAWSHLEPKCLGQCQVPIIMNGTIRTRLEAAWVNDATTVQIDCLHGLVVNDTGPIRCDNGSWTVIPTCVPAPCKRTPPQIKYGMRIFFSVSHKSRARYFCVAGYKLLGDRYITCEYGRWTGTRPRCEENFCDNPGYLPNGRIFTVGSVGEFPFEEYITTIRHGDRLTYKCNRNYKLIGPRGAACVNGKWRPWPKPTCRQSKHPLFYKIWRPWEEKIKGGRMYY